MAELPKITPPDLESLRADVKANAEGAQSALSEKVENAQKQAEAVKERVEEIREEDNQVSEKKIALPLRIWGFASIVVGVLVIPLLVVIILALISILTGHASLKDYGTDVSNQALVLTCIDLIIHVLLSAQFIILGSRLIRNKRKGVGRQANIMIGFAVAALICSIMLAGMGWVAAYNLAIVVVLVAMSSYFDPTLAEERRLQRKLRDMENRDDQEAGTLGRDKTGKGYITLNFFNIFWVFVVACVVGLLFESAVCPFLNGRIENRTGMLWGPFSPIYGLGAVLFTLALNRFYNRNGYFIFAVSGCIGAAFEYLVSWFFQFAFGIVAWDYSGEFMNLDGRTDLFHAIVWGILGLWWIKSCLPFMLKVINKIPWNWRYGVTSVFAAFMVVNGAMTLLAFDCWYQRVAGVTPDTPVAEFFAENYDNDFMHSHFQTMSIDPSRATRS